MCASNINKPKPILRSNPEPPSRTDGTEASHELDVGLHFNVPDRKPERKTSETSVIAKTRPHQCSRSVPLKEFIRQLKEDAIFSGCRPQKWSRELQVLSRGRTQVSSLRPNARSQAGLARQPFADKKPRQVPPRHAPNSAVFVVPQRIRTQRGEDAAQWAVVRERPPLSSSPSIIARDRQSSKLAERRTGREQRMCS